MQIGHVGLLLSAYWKRSTNIWATDCNSLIMIINYSACTLWHNNWNRWLSIRFFVKSFAFICWLILPINYLVNTLICSATTKWCNQTMLFTWSITAALNFAALNVDPTNAFIMWIGHNNNSISSNDNDNLLKSTLVIYMLTVPSLCIIVLTSNIYSPMKQNVSLKMTVYDFRVPTSVYVMGENANTLSGTFTCLV